MICILPASRSTQIVECNGLKHISCTYTTQDHIVSCLGNRILFIVYDNNTKATMTLCDGVFEIPN